MVGEMRDPAITNLEFHKEVDSEGWRAFLYLKIVLTHEEMIGPNLQRSTSIKNQVIQSIERLKREFKIEE